SRAEVREERTALERVVARLVGHFLSAPRQQGQQYQGRQSPLPQAQRLEKLIGWRGRGVRHADITSFPRRLGGTDHLGRGIEPGKQAMDRRLARHVTSPDFRPLSRESRARACASRRSKSPAKTE